MKGEERQWLGSNQAGKLQRLPGLEFVIVAIPTLPVLSAAKGLAAGKGLRGVCEDEGRSAALSVRLRFIRNEHPSHCLFILYCHFIVAHRVLLRNEIYDVI